MIISLYSSHPVMAELNHYNLPVKSVSATLLIIKQLYHTIKIENRVSIELFTFEVQV